MASAAHELAISKHSTSISGAWFRPGLRRLYWWFCRSASMRARVSSETPLRPLSTLETVEMETSARRGDLGKGRPSGRFPDVISADMPPAYGDRREDRRHRALTACYRAVLLKVSL